MNGKQIVIEPLLTLPFTHLFDLGNNSKLSSEILIIDTKKRIMCTVIM